MMLNGNQKFTEITPVHADRVGASVEGVQARAYWSRSEGEVACVEEPIVLIVKAETLLGLGLSSACGERIGSMRVRCVDLNEMIAGRTRSMDVQVILIDASGNDGDATALVRIARDLHGDVPIALAVGDERHCSFEVLGLADRGEIRAVIGASTTRAMSGHVLQYLSNGGRYLPDASSEASRPQALDDTPRKHDVAGGSSITLPPIDPLGAPLIAAPDPDREPLRPARTCQRSPVKGSVPLTPREHEVVKLVAEGLQNKLIAHTLGLSEHTVKVHLQHAFRKLGAKNRTQAASAFNTLYG